MTKAYQIRTVAPVDRDLWETHEDVLFREVYRNAISAIKARGEIAATVEWTVEHPIEIDGVCMPWTYDGVVMPPVTMLRFTTYVIPNGLGLKELEEGGVV